MGNIPARDMRRIQKLAGRLESVIQTFVFIQPPQYITHEFSFPHDNGYCIADVNAYGALVNSLATTFPTISRQAIEKQCTRRFNEIITDFVVKQSSVKWDEKFTFVDSGREMPSSEYLQTKVEQLVADLTRLNRAYRVFVPILGIALEMPEYDFGPVKLVRTENSLPIVEKSSSLADFTYVHDDIMNHFAKNICLVESDITGDTEYVRQEGLRLTGQLAAILNLHRSSRSARSDIDQKIQCAGVPSLYTRVTLQRTLLPDEQGIPTYVHSTTSFGVRRQNLNQSHLDTIKGQGFDNLWRSFESPTNRLHKRVKRATTWFDKAVNFDELDAQIVGLATALEILLVSSGDRNNLHITWGSISQQLADKCAFLLGHDLHSTMEIAKQVKRLYGVRSKIVHEGAELTEDSYSARYELANLTSQVILNFVQQDFDSFEKFEQWIIRQKYSVNFSEIDRLSQAIESEQAIAPMRATPTRGD